MKKKNRRKVKNNEKNDIPFQFFQIEQGFFTRDLMQATDNFAGANENCC